MSAKLSAGEATVLVQVLHLLNRKPRFGVGDRRAAFDSYSTASQVERMLERHGWDWKDPAIQPPGH